MNLKITVIQQSDGTPPGSVNKWIKGRGHLGALYQLQRGDVLPTMDSTDLVVILGGPMNVDEVEKYPWLVSEKDWLKRAIAAGKCIFGICLGGQLLSQVLGGVVQPHTHWEVGWHDVKFSDGRHLKVFQWHHDTFSIPPGAQLLASNQITENQAFTFGEKIVGIQFHPEATESWINECAAEVPYPEGPFVQNGTEILAQVPNISAMQAWMFAELDRLAAIATSRS